MAKTYYRQITVLLRQHGFEQVPGGKGSHEKWRNADGLTVIVPRSKSKVTANSVLKAAGIDVSL